MGVNRQTHLINHNNQTVIFSLKLKLGTITKLNYFRIEVIAIIDNMEIFSIQNDRVLLRYYSDFLR